MTIGLVATILWTVVIAMPGADKDKTTFHGVRGESVVAYDSLFTVAEPLADSGPGRALLESCMERYGGRAHLGDLKAFRISFDMRSTLSGDSLRIVRTFRPDRSHRIDRRSVEKRESRILRGPEAWYLRPDTLFVLDGGRYRSELFSYLTLAMPLAVETEPFDHVRYGTRDGDPLGYIYMSKTDSLMIVLGIDPGSGLILSSEGVIRQGESSFTFVNLFDEHRTVDGYVFPGRLTSVSMGLPVGKSVLVGVEVNPVLPAGAFIPAPVFGTDEFH